MFAAASGLAAALGGVVVDWEHRQRPESRVPALQDRHDTCERPRATLDPEPSWRCRPRTRSTSSSAFAEGGGVCSPGCGGNRAQPFSAAGTACLSVPWPWCLGSEPQVSEEQKEAPSEAGFSPTFRGGEAPRVGPAAPEEPRRVLLPIRRRTEWFFFRVLKMPFTGA